MTRRPKKRNRTTPEGTRPGKHPPRHSTVPGLLDGLWPAKDPLEVLAQVSMIVAASEPQRVPFGPTGSGSDEGIDFDELFVSFTETNIPETTALLIAAANLLAVPGSSGSPHLLSRIESTVRVRTHMAPNWLARLHQAQATRVVSLQHVLRDGDNILLEVTLDGGAKLTAIYYIDHNLGSILKDAFIIDEPLESLQAEYLDMGDEYTSVVDLDPKTARAMIVAAADRTAMMWPPFESDTWPALRPLVLWMASLLPSGGRAEPMADWSEAEISELISEFIESPEGAALGAPTADDVRPLIWFATEYGPGDPLRWSASSAEGFLLDWVPRKLMVPDEVLEGIPLLLRFFVGFAHRKRGIAPELSAEVMSAIDEFEPEFYDLLAAADGIGLDESAAQELLVALLELDADGGAFSSGQSVALLADEVGSAEALESLTDTPLPHEDLDLTGIPDDIVERVARISTLADDGTKRYFSPELAGELVTAQRRFLADVARADPQIFRRKAKDEYAAAGLAWAIGTVNRLYYRNHTVSDHMAEFGATGSNGSSRGKTMVGAIQPSMRYATSPNLQLGRPDLLVSERRAWIIERRDASGAQQPTPNRENAPVNQAGHGVLARPSSRRPIRPPIDFGDLG